MAHQLPEGHSLGTLTIIRLLGSGGMADVYEALDNRLGRHVAVKVLPQEYSRNQDFIMRFEREVKASAALSHPNIVTVFEFGSEDSLNYYTMRLLNGGDLRDRITKGMTIVDVLTTMRGVLQAFQHAHSRGFVHRDVKPENIMYDEQGTPTLTDFGIAKVLDSQTQMTQTGMAVGTPRYISPEQATGKPVDGRSDLYSLGCILYEMLTGSSPYKADTPIATIFQHVNEPIPVLSDEYSQFQPLLEKLMAKSPETRMQSADEALAYIDETFPRDWTGVFNAHTTQGMPVAGGQTPAVTPIRTQTVPAAGGQDEEKTQLLTTGAGAGFANAQATRGGTPSDDFGATVVMPKAEVKPGKSAGRAGFSPAILGAIVLLLAAASGGAYLFLLEPDSAVEPVPPPATAEESGQQEVTPAGAVEKAGETEDDSAAKAAAAAAAREAQRQAQIKAREEAERRAQQEAAQRAAAERKAREEAELKARQEAAARAAAEQKAREEAARRAEAEQKAREEQTAREIEAERQSRQKAQQQTAEPTADPAAAEAARREAEEKRQAQEAAQRRKAEQDRRDRERREAQQAEAERLQRLEAERIQAEQERQAVAEQEQARQEEEERKKKLKKPVPVGF